MGGSNRTRDTVTLEYTVNELPFNHGRKLSAPSTCPHPHKHKPAGSDKKNLTNTVGSCGFEQKQKINTDTFCILCLIQIHRVSKHATNTLGQQVCWVYLSDDVWIPHFCCPAEHFAQQHIEQRWTPTEYSLCHPFLQRLLKFTALSRSPHVKCILREPVSVHQHAHVRRTAKLSNMRLQKCCRLMIDSEEFGGEVVVVKVVETHIAVLSTGHETAVW